MTSTMSAAPVNAGAVRAVTRPTDHIPATRAFVAAVLNFLDGRPFDSDSDAHRLRHQAAGVLRLLPPDPPADLRGLAELAAVADGACRRFLARCETEYVRDEDRIQGAVFDLTGVAYHLAEIGDHLPAVDAARLRGRPTHADADGLTKEGRLAALLALLEAVEFEAEEKADRLRFDDPLGHRLRGLVWCLREGTACQVNEVRLDVMAAARERLERDDV